MVGKLVVVIVALVALAGIGIVLLRGDAPPPAVLAPRSEPAGAFSAAVSPGAAATSAPADGQGAAAAEGASSDGAWTLSPDGTSYVGYRVDEQLADRDLPNQAVGRTAQVSGTLTLAGSVVQAVQVTADLTALTSDVSRRDQAIRTNGLESDTYPQAMFTLTEPIDLGAVPATGQEVTAQAVGDLTLHGTTRPVTLALTARWDQDRLDVAGSAPVSLADFGISAPVLGPVVTIDDAAVVELAVTFLR